MCAHSDLSIEKESELASRQPVLVWQLGILADVTTGLEIVTALFTELVSTREPIAKFDEGFSLDISSDLDLVAHQRGLCPRIHGDTYWLL